MSDVTAVKLATICPMMAYNHNCLQSEIMKHPRLAQLLIYILCFVTSSVCRV